MSGLRGYLRILLCMHGPSPLLLVLRYLLIIRQWVPLILFRWLPLHINIPLLLYVRYIEVPPNMRIKVLLIILLHVHSHPHSHTHHPIIVHWVCGDLGIIGTILLEPNASLHVHNTIINIILVDGFSGEDAPNAAHLGEATAACLLIDGGLYYWGVEVIPIIVAVVGAAIGVDEGLDGWVLGELLEVVEWVGIVDMVGRQLLIGLVLGLVGLHDGGRVHVIEYLAVLGRLRDHPLLLLLIMGA